MIILFLSLAVAARTVPTHESARAAPPDAVFGNPANTAEPAPEPGQPPAIEITQVLIQERVIVRVPVRPPPPAPAPVEWHEEKSGNCISTKEISGAAVTQPGAVDFLLRGGTRIRARFASECPALDFYSGFYLKPTPDNRICAGRDSIHARSGGACEIDRFRVLVPKRQKGR